VTWCAACHEKAGKREGAMRKRHRTIDTRISEATLATSSRGLRLGYISRKRHSFTDYRCFAL
jgi:cytochrome c553